MGLYQLSKMNYFTLIRDVTRFRKFKFSDCKIEENNGFLKHVCYKEQDEGYIATEFKCSHSEEFYTKIEDPAQLMNSFADNICSSDPHFYQMCDKRLGGKITNNEVLCEYYLCSLWATLIITPLHPFFLMVGQCTDECDNTDLNKVGCNDEKVEINTKFFCSAGNKRNSNLDHKIETLIEIRLVNRSDLLV